MLEKQIIHACFQAAMAADQAWSIELERVFGRAAGDARYDDRGEQTPRLKALRDAKLATDAALLASWNQV